MDLEFSDDQRMLKDMVDRFVADDYGFEARQRVLKGDEAWSRETWRSIAELGLLMVTVPEARGGMATGGVEAMIVGEAFGQGLLLEPWLATVLATAMLGDRADLIAPVLAGERVVAGAIDGALALDGDRVSGQVAFVLHGASADALVLAASDARGTPHVVLIEAGQPGVEREGHRLHGGGEAARITCTQASAEILASGAAASALLADAHAAGIAAIAADALGAGQAAFDLTVEHLKTRVQFGQPIGSNQALQHRAAEMFVELEQLRSAALYGACMVHHPDSQERERAMAAVRVVTARAARFLAQNAVQLHGGIGVTDEHRVGHCFMRLSADALLFGDGDENAARLAALGGFVGARAYWDEAG